MFIVILYTIVTSQQLQIEAILKNQGDFTNEGYIDLKAQNAANIEALNLTSSALKANVSEINSSLKNMKKKHDSDRILMTTKIAELKKSLGSDDKTLTNAIDEESSTETSEASSIKSL